MSKQEGSIWITGASSGIGRETAIRFLENGYCVAATARRKDLISSLEEFVNEGKLLSMDLDVTDNEGIQKAAAKIDRLEPLNCLINNAGITTFSPVTENNYEESKKIIETNLLGAINATEAVLPYMIENKKGTIINIISVAAKKTFTNSSIYAASKAGLLAYANVLREEMRQNNIKVINILPGATKTPIWPNDALEKYSERMMSPKDIASFIFDLYRTKSSVVPEEVKLRPMKGDI